MTSGTPDPELQAIDLSLNFFDHIKYACESQGLELKFQRYSIEKVETLRFRALALEGLTLLFKSILFLIITIFVRINFKPFINW